MDGGEAAKGTEPVSAAGAGDVNISVELEAKRCTGRKLRQ
jgi:hypothetical protein